MKIQFGELQGLKPPSVHVAYAAVETAAYKASCLRRGKSRDIQELLLFQ